MREGAEAMGGLLDPLPDTQAVICVSDLSAFGALKRMSAARASVPGRLVHREVSASYEIGAISVPTLSPIDPFPAPDRGRGGGV